MTLVDNLVGLLLCGCCSRVLRSRCKGIAIKPRVEHFVTVGQTILVEQVLLADLTAMRRLWVLKAIQVQGRSTAFGRQRVLFRTSCAHHTGRRPQRRQFG